MDRKSNAKQQEHSKPVPEKKIATPAPKQQMQPAAKGAQGGKSEVKNALRSQIWWVWRVMGKAQRKRKAPPPSSSSAPASKQQPRDAKYAIAAITDPPSPVVSTKESFSHERQPIQRAPNEPLDVPAAFDLHELPRSVLELVFSFAVKDLSLKIRPSRCKGWKRVHRPKVAIDALSEWRAVCKYWHECIGEIVTQFKQRRLKINFSYKNHAQVQESVSQIVLRGEKLVDLRVALYGYYDVRHGLDAASCIAWEDILRHCPNLQRLDLSEMAFLTRMHMAKLVQAASEHCLKLQALILPLPLAWDKYARFYTRVREDEDAFSPDDEIFVSHLETALARWFTRGRHSGLRQLTTAHSIWTSNAFVSALANYCPKIEVLDGWKLTYLCDGWSPITCDEEWKVALDRWELFCQRCVNLREFNWAVVPFTDEFFRPFGATPKVLLSDLLMDFSDSLDDDASSDEEDRPPRQPPRGVHELPATATAAANVRTSRPRTPNSYFDISKPYTSEGLCALLRGLPFLTRFKVYLHPRTRIDLNVFDDRFLNQLAQSTPYLEKLSIVEPGQYEGTDAIGTITEKGLTALAGMPSLSDVALTALKEVSADGILAFVRNRAASVRQRNIKIGVMKGIGICIIDILKALAKAEPRSFEGRSFAVVIENQGLYRGCVADSSLSTKRVEDKLHSLRTLLEKLHPTLRCQLTLEKERNPLLRKDLPYHIAKFAIFSTNWKFPSEFGSGTFYRGDISYDPKEAFEMILKVGA
ncbi:hypothetical protein FI667_g4458, partial [Globisporangium splendens]